MSESRKRRKSRAFQKLIVIVIVLIIVVLVSFFCIFRPLKERLVSTVAQELITSQLPSGTLSDADAEAILDSMSPEDRAMIEDIISSHISAGTISDIMSYVSSGDMAGLRDYARNSLSEEEMNHLLSIYEKYQDTIDSYLK